MTECTWMAICRVTVEQMEALIHNAIRDFVD